MRAILAAVLLSFAALAADSPKAPTKVAVHR
jgi:hypothetical protein